MKNRFKAILLAGGRGTRLYPLTAILSKQLVPLYNKPMIYYPLTTIMVAGIADILVITTGEDRPRFQALLGDGGQWGIRLRYATQDQPRGIAEALLIGADFTGDGPVMLMLGDNVIYGRLDFLRDAMSRNGEGATIFAHRVADPSRYGVVEFDARYRAISLEEKPAVPRSPWAVPGIYLYGPGASARARALEPSARGELEITDLNRMYLEAGALQVRPMGRGIAWFDTGTPESLLSASNFVEAIESRQGLVVGSPEEVAYRMGFLTRDGLRATLERLPPSPYREYIERIADEVDHEQG
jgi:glucose-1-phosphate thymidylyltransferase